MTNVEVRETTETAITESIQIPDDGQPYMYNILTGLCSRITKITRVHLVDRKIVKVFVYCGTTKYEGVSRCSPNDHFDLIIGTELALAQAMWKLHGISNGTVAKLIRS